MTWAGWFERMLQQMRRNWARSYAIGGPAH
jgi:hypothetical protein